MMDFKMDGLDELMREIENIGKDMQNHKDEAVLEAGRFFQKEVKKMVPVRTGNLRDHIEVSDVENGMVDVFVDQQGKAYYGVMVEEGTSTMRAQPYMYPTYQRAKGKIRAKLMDTLRMRLML